MASVSRHCAGAMTYSSPFTAQEAFLDEICAFVRDKNIDVVIPVLEETYTMAKCRNKLERCGAAFLLPEYGQILALHDKGALTAAARNLGIAVPPTWELAELLADSSLASALPFPVIIKPKQGGGGWGMRTAETPETLLRVARQGIEHPGRYIVQAVIPGHLLCACGIYYKGQCLASDSFIAATAYPLRVGQSTTRQSRAVPEALDALQTLLDHLSWHGVCQIDFILNPEDGRCVMLDANPRFWGSITQNIAAGVDYPWYYTRLALGDTDFAPGVARDGVRTCWLGGDCMRLAAEFKEAADKWGYIYEALRSNARYAAYDDWNLTDPMPFIAWGCNMLAGKLLKRKKDALPGVWK